MDDAQELAFLRFLFDTGAQLERVRDVEKALRVVLRHAREHYGAERTCIAVLDEGRAAMVVRQSLPADLPPDAWKTAALRRFLLGKRPRLARHTLLAAIERRGRPWAVLALQRLDGVYPKELVAPMARVGELVSRHLARIDAERSAEVRARIDQKLLEQLRPRDLFYRLLHGLRSLTRYDHSAAVYMHAGEPGELTLVAEQVSWRKGGSHRVGRRLELSTELRALLDQGQVFGFERARDGKWQEWSGERGLPLAELLDDEPDPNGAAPDAAPSPPPQGALLCAPLATREGLLGVLEISSIHAGSLGPYEARLLLGFLTHAAIALTHLRRAESLEHGMVEAEKKHAVADMARGVSHDVNNAVGTALPLVQQMIAELEEGTPPPAQTWLEDLHAVLDSLSFCRRVFGQMLSFARGTAQVRVGEGDLVRALDSTLSIVAESMRRNLIEVERSVEAQLPAVRAAQSDLEQLVLNLCTNARDAMPDGGQLGLRLYRAGRDVVLEVRDTGGGIPAENLARVREPFFTTKPGGSGLGLSICRSIVWNLSGRLSIDSREGEGTLARVRLPAAP